jgi:hypothetical protein
MGQSVGGMGAIPSVPVPPPSSVPPSGDEPLPLSPPLPLPEALFPPLPPLELPPLLVEPLPDGAPPGDRSPLLHPPAAAKMTALRSARPRLTAIADCIPIPSPTHRVHHPFRARGPVVDR